VRDHRGDALGHQRISWQRLRLPSQRPVQREQLDNTRNNVAKGKEDIKQYGSRSASDPKGRTFFFVNIEALEESDARQSDSNGADTAAAIR